MNQDLNKQEYDLLRNISPLLIGASKALHSSIIEAINKNKIEPLIFLCNVTYVTLYFATTKNSINNQHLEKAITLIDKISKTLYYIKQTTPNHVKKIKNNIVIETREVYFPWNKDIVELRTKIISFMGITKKICEQCGLNFDQLYEEA